MSARPKSSTGVAVAEGMLPLLKRHEIQVLVRAGHALADVARRTGASEDTVARVRDEAAVVATDDAAARKARKIGRPSKAAAHTESVRSWLAEEPDLPTQEIFRRAKEIGYVGRKSALYGLVAGLRPPRAAPVVRFEGLPGEFSQHDFGEVDVRFVNGRTQRVHFFASRLKYSRFVAVVVVRPRCPHRAERLQVRRGESAGLWNIPGDGDLAGGGFS